MTTETTNRRPTHIVWQVIGEGDKAIWIRIGAGWTNRDGKGINLKYDAMPLTGRTIVREATVDAG
jgi:hypothetical protein